MKKFCCILTLVLLMISSRAFAEDVLIVADDSDSTRGVEWYVQTELLEEDLDNKTFEVPVKLVIIMKQSGERTEHARFLLQEFRLVDGVWYARQKNSSHDFGLLGESEFNQKVFDACKPYSELAQTYPR